MRALGLLVVLTAGCTSSGASGNADAGDGAPSTQNLCNNQPDLAARARLYCPGNKSLDGVAAECGISCVTAPDAGGCTSDCIVKETGGVVSSSCAGCFAVMVLCARDNCLNECIGDPLGNTCLDCRCGDNFPGHANCYVPTYACSGVLRDDCQRLEAGTWRGYPTGDAGCAQDAASD